ncbi:hypothetical protein D3C73_1557980 [compost metagenome]
MKMFGIALLLSGIFLLGLSGLEKVIIFAAIVTSFKAIDISTLKDLTPPYIWNLTNLTFTGGIILLIAGLVLFLIYLAQERKMNQPNGKG